MRRALLVMMVVTWVAAAGRIQAQTTLSIRAAARSPVAGWQQMASPDGNQIVWVDPASSVTSADIERVSLDTASDGNPAVAIRFTDDGAKKVATLSTRQVGKPIAFVLDGRLISVPVIRDPIGREAVISGGPGGLTREEIERLLAAFGSR